MGDGSELSILNKVDFTDTQEVYDAVLLDFTFHTMMLQCPPRMENFMKAIFKDNGKAVRGKVVADCGTGSGVLAMWCAKAGAKKVYAIEPNDNIDIARKNIAKNNLQDKIELIHARCEEAELPEKVDVIIAEVVACMLVGDGIIPWMIAFRDKWLKEDGVMMPDTGTATVAPICDEQFYGKSLDLYRTFEVRYGLDMTEMIPDYKASMAGKTFQKIIAPESVKAKPCEIALWDFKTLPREKADNFTGAIDFTMTHDTTIHGFCGWFAIKFGDVVISTGPFDRRSHWSMCVFYLNEPLDLKKGDVIKGSFSVETSKKRAPMIENNINYTINEGKPMHKFWMTGPDYGQMIHAVGLDGR